MFVTSFLFVSNLNSVFAADKTKKKANQDSLSDLKYVEGDEQGNEVRALKTELLISASEEKAISQIKVIDLTHTHPKVGEISCNSNTKLTLNKLRKL